MSDEELARALDCTQWAYQHATKPTMQPKQPDTDQRRHTRRLWRSLLHSLQASLRAEQASLRAVQTSLGAGQASHISQTATPEQLPRASQAKD